MSAGLVFSPWLIDGSLLSPSVHSLFPVCDCVSISPYYKGTSQAGLGPIHMTLLILIYFLKLDLQI